MKRKREESTEEGTWIDPVLYLECPTGDVIEFIWYWPFQFRHQPVIRSRAGLFFLHVMLPTNASLVENVAIPENSRYQTA